MATTDTDRRRFFLATALTMLALPALWWANQSDGAPNVATAGLAVGASATTVDDLATAPALTAPRSPAGLADATGDTDDTDDTDPPPVFLDGPAGQVGAGLPEIAVPATTGERLRTTATFRSSLGSSTTCIASGVNNGERVVVVNLDNGRSVTCTALLAPSGADQQLVMSGSLFAEIADPTDAPIPVEIRR